MLVHVWHKEKHLTLDLEYPSMGETIRVDFGRGQAIKRVHTDREGKRYFIWDNTRIDLEFLKTYNMKKIQEKLANREHVMEYELILAILNDGVENVRFINPCYKRSQADIFGLGIFTSETDDVVCKISEHRYKVADGYKMTLVPENEDLRYASDDYYTSDLMSLLRSGRVKIVTNKGENKQEGCFCG